MDYEQETMHGRQFLEKFSLSLPVNYVAPSFTDNLDSISL
jgi:hypothetical protein